MAAKSGGAHQGEWHVGDGACLAAKSGGARQGEWHGDGGAGVAAKSVGAPQDEWFGGSSAGMAAKSGGDHQGEWHDEDVGSASEAPSRADAHVLGYDLDALDWANGDVAAIDKVSQVAEDGAGCEEAP